jgi:Ca2+-transporting ATPase
MDAHNLSVDAVLRQCNSNPAGLSAADAVDRLHRYGANRLNTEFRLTPFAILLGQFKDTIIYILLAAVLFSALIGEYVDALIIVIILVANGMIGFFQELSAQKSLAALKKMSATRARVYRDEKIIRLDAAELVPGDILILEAGDRIGADARVIQTTRLQIAEDALTGESLPVEKQTEPIGLDAQIGDRSNMIFAATAVVAGHGRAVVTATGMKTEIGKITAMLGSTEPAMTPLQRRLHVFGRKLGATVLAVCFLVFLLFVVRGYFAQSLSLHSLTGFIFIAISLAVAAVPTALPAVITIALSIGVKRLLKKKALVRNLASVETLGSCDVICTDKTGTITENRMQVRNLWTLDKKCQLTNDGILPGDPVTGASEKKTQHPAETSPRTSSISQLLTIGFLCNNASLKKENNIWVAEGEPTEKALALAAANNDITSKASRIDELPFDSERKLMSVLCTDPLNTLHMYCKGAPDALLAKCNTVLSNGEKIPLTERLRMRILEQNERYGAKALRVLGFAEKQLHNTKKFQEKELTFIGLQAMQDPPRKDVKESIVIAAQAGIRVIMITGDFPATAAAIGKEVGIQGKSCSGRELERMDTQQLHDALQAGTNIFARVSPEHKLRIIDCLQTMGHTVAMTGDGINDAPALKKADIGIAVGSGTEVARDTADLVLLDDSFTNVVNTIEEGRGIYDNIQKSIMLLLSGNLGEVLIILLAALLGLNLPLTAILLLWINMITDGAPALAFAVDPYGKGIMQRRPKPKNENILPADKLRLLALLGSAATLLALTLFTFSGGRETGQPLLHAQTMVFNFVVLYECILVFVIRKQYRVSLYSNIWIWASIALCFLLQALLMYSPLHSIFGITALGMHDLALLGATGLLFYGISLLFKRKKS